MQREGRRRRAVRAEAIRILGDERFRSLRGRRRLPLGHVDVFRRFLQRRSFGLAVARTLVDDAIGGHDYDRRRCLRLISRRRSASGAGSDQAETEERIEPHDAPSSTSDANAVFSSAPVTSGTERRRRRDLAMQREVRQTDVVRCLVAARLDPRFDLAHRRRRLPLVDAHVLRRASPQARAKLRSRRRPRRRNRRRRRPRSAAARGRAASQAMGRSRSQRHRMERPARPASSSQTSTRRPRPQSGDCASERI